MDPDTIWSLRSRIRKDLLPYCEGGSMIPMDLSQTVMVARNDSGDPGLSFGYLTILLASIFTEILCDFLRK